MSDDVIDPQWQTGPMFDPTNLLHRQTAERRLRRDLYAAALKMLLLGYEGDPTVCAVINLHSPGDSSRSGYDECPGCPGSCCFGPEPWPCATAELIGEQLGLPIVPEWRP